MTTSMKLLRVTARSPRLASAGRDTPTSGRSYATFKTTYKDYRNTSEREYKKKSTKATNQVRLTALIPVD